MLVIIDFGLGNLGSVLHKIHKIGQINAVISSKIEEIEKADKMILPGVGHFKTGMKNLADLNLIDTLNHKVLIQKTPILGICLGLQLFTKQSEEGNMPGLGWLDAITRKFAFATQGMKLKIPHVGWNLLNIVNENPLFDDIPRNHRFYFTHSYHLDLIEENAVIATTDYGYDFACAVQKGNIVGVQFHPEKSHKLGMKIIQNFIQRF